MTIKKFLRKYLSEHIIDCLFELKWIINKYKSYSRIEKDINYLYRKIFSRSMNWDNPKTYTEKIQFSKVYNPTKQKSNLSDKIQVRKWIKDRIGEEYLIPIINIYDSFDDIDFSTLPKAFVIKCNHDSGSTTIIKDKNKINDKYYNYLKRKYKFFLRRNMAFMNFEMHYKNIIPKIIIEQLMIDENHDEILDYKFLCFHGKPYYFWTDFDRFGNHTRNMYNLDWELQPFNQWTYKNYKGNIEKPKNFNLMLELVKQLCIGFDHVRVDMYSINDKIYFGEMTFSNGCGFERIIPDKYDYILGELWNINTDNRKFIKGKYNE